MNSNTTTSAVSVNKKHLEFTCYVRIERNGVEVKFKNANSTALSKVSIVEMTKKDGNAGAKNIFYVVIRNKDNEQYFIFEAGGVERWIDKFVGEGKLTILVSKGNEKSAVFLSKTTKDVLDNFTKRLSDVKNPKVAESSDINMAGVKKTNNTANPTNNIKNEKKKQLAELYAKKIQPGQNAKLKKNDGTVVKANSQQRKINLNELPNDLINFILDYIDRKSLTKVSIVNRDFKNIFDTYIDRLVFRNDTPSNMFNVLLSRFKHLKHLGLGKGKYLKNENFKFFNVDLKQLAHLDISEVQNLNEASLTKLLSKTKNTMITSIKLNIYIDCLPVILRYINKFFINLEDLYIYPFYNHITTNVQCNKFEKLLTEVETEYRFFNPELYKSITELFEKKKYLNTFAVFFLNAPLINEKVFTNLNHLCIEILMIEKVKDLRVLSNLVNLTTFSLKEIVVLDFQTKKKLKKVNFDNLILYIDTEGSNSINSLSLDFDNDYIENFVNIFSKMKKLTELTFGTFANKEIVKLISLYLKNLKGLKLNSNLVTDECLADVLMNCKLEFLDLRGCNYIQGNCLVENDLPESLKNIKLSLMSYNFSTLISYLKSRGITAENYIFK
jgi:hypothetical protein